jgi:hypothetical protein
MTPEERRLYLEDWGKRVKITPKKGTPKPTELTESLTEPVGPPVPVKGPGVELPSIELPMLPTLPPSRQPEQGIPLDSSFVQAPAAPKQPQTNETSTVVSKQVNQNKIDKFRDRLLSSGMTPQDVEKAIKMTFGEKPPAPGTGGIRQNLLNAEAYTPMSAAQGKIYDNTQKRIFDNTAAMAESHDRIIGLTKLAEEEVNEQSRRHADNIIQEREVESLKRGAEELYADTINENSRALNQKLNQVEVLYDQAMKESMAADEITGWDIFRKSAIAIGALAAAGGTVLGQMALAKSGGMPNVLMPLIAKAIDADMEYMTSRKSKADTALNKAQKLHAGYTQIFKDRELADLTAKDSLFKYWDKNLEFYKNRLPEGGRKRLLEDAQKAIKLQHEQHQLKLRGAYNKFLEENTGLMVNSIKNEEDFKNQFVNRNYNVINALNTYKNFTASSSEKMKRPKLTNDQIGKVDHSSSLLKMMRPLKANITKLVNQFQGGGGWFSTVKNVAEIKFSDLVGQFRDSEEAALLSEVKGQLLQLGRRIGATVENRLTNEDAQFWQETVGTDLDSVSIMTAVQRLVSAEYSLRETLIDNASLMGPAQFGQNKLRMDAAFGADSFEVLQNYNASVKSFIDNKDSASPIYNVGMSKINESFRFTDENWARLQLQIMDRFTNDITYNRIGQVDVQKNRREAIESRSDVVTRDSPIGKLLPVPTKEGEGRAHLKPEMATDFIAMHDSAKKAGIEIIASGSRAGYRSEQDTESLIKEGYSADPRGGHTEHGGANSIDIAVDASTESKKYKWLVDNGAKFGFFPHGIPDYDGHHHWIYDQSRKTGR